MSVVVCSSLCFYSCAGRSLFALNKLSWEGNPSLPDIDFCYNSITALATCTRLFVGFARLRHQLILGSFLVTNLLRPCPLCDKMLLEDSGVGTGEGSSMPSDSCKTISSEASYFVWLPSAVIKVLHVCPWLKRNIGILRRPLIHRRTLVRTTLRDSSSFAVRLCVYIFWCVQAATAVAAALKRLWSIQSSLSHCFVSVEVQFPGTHEKSSYKARKHPPYALACKQLWRRYAKGVSRTYSFALVF